MWLSWSPSPFSIVCYWAEVTCSKRTADALPAGTDQQASCKLTSLSLFSFFWFHSCLPSLLGADLYCKLLVSAALLTNASWPLWCKSKSPKHCVPLQPWGLVSHTAALFSHKPINISAYQHTLPPTSTAHNTLRTKDTQVYFTITLHNTSQVWSCVLALLLVSVRLHSL